MTREERDNAITILENEKKCVNRANKNDYCNRDCYNCELVKTATEILTALDMAIKALQEQADNIPVMYYPQVDGITPTVVAQADGEKTCGTCRNEDTYHCAECENKSDYEQAQADGEYISRQQVMSDYADWYGYDYQNNWFYKYLKNMPSVAIPSAEPKTGHWIKMPLIEAGQTYSHECSLCGRRILTTNAGLSEFPYCHCGAKMVEPQESEVKE